MTMLKAMDEPRALRHGRTLGRRGETSASIDGDAIPVVIPAKAGTQPGFRPRFREGRHCAGMTPVTVVGASDDLLIPGSSP